MLVSFRCIAWVTEHDFIEELSLELGVTDPVSGLVITHKP
ncbi:hypothetical protein SynBIOSU31_02069 [Synechococcus sp. BIOS-U3-1]|nr:hypothetical protein SynBIOSU31_02069 [Synechococcus sp. BIOS-U3-1]